MTDLAFLGAARLAQMIRDRAISSVELLDHFIARIDKYNPRLNAVVVRDFARARDAARVADHTLAAGERTGPLHGVPMTVKESFAVAGLPTTFGLPAYRDNIAGETAVAVQRLIAAGAIVFGKTNVPPWLADSQSSNDVYGATGNPWDLALSPGGSSGGAAAALAAGLTGLELGSDIAGSIRNPAHYCGVYGHKTTYSLCPATGHSLAPSVIKGDISVIGPLARSAEDLALALGIIAGPDAIESRAYSFHLPPPRKTTLKDFRLALVADHPLAEVDKDVREELDQLGAFLKAEGAEVSLTARPEFDARALDAAYMTMVRAATSMRLNDADFAAASAAARSVDLKATDVRTKYLRGNTMSHREWLRLDEERHSFRMAWERFFADFDLLLCPIAVTTAFPRTTVDVADRTLRVNGRDVSYGDQFFWSGYGGLAYLPATIAPIRKRAGGLPVGVQIIGRQYDDLTCIELAKLLERHYRPFIPPPGYA